MSALHSLEGGHTMATGPGESKALRSEMAVKALNTRETLSKSESHL